MMNGTVLVWGGLTVLAWGLFGYAAKRSTTFFGRFQNGSIYTLIYQPLGFALTAGAWGLWISDFQPTFHLAGSLYAMLAGALLGLGLYFFAKALARQHVSLVTPVTSLYPLVTLLISFLLTTQTVTRFQTVGLILSVPGILLLNGRLQNQTKPQCRSWLTYSLLTTLCWGLFALFPDLALNHLSRGDVAFYQAIGYLVGGTLLGLITVSGRLRYDSNGFRFAILCGMASGLGSISYIYAIQAGSVAIVAPMTGLYPVVTILLARLLLSEHIALQRKFGVAFACISIVMMSM